MYVLPNRKAFADSVTRIFMKYRQRSLLEAGQGAARELFPHQKLVRDYLLIETPYRGLLLFHGLGVGKTCASIAVAESLMSNKKVYVLLPASLRDNFLGEIRTCGDPIYVEDQHWVEKKANTDEEREKAFKMGISEKFINEQGRYFVTVADMPSNFKNNPELQAPIRKQIADIIDSRFHFINFNGLSSSNIDKILGEEHMFDNSVIIIDEVHNLISGVVNDREIKRRLYDMIYNAVDAKVVALTGTPVVNRPQEIAFLMNLLRGPVKQLGVPTKSAVSWDESMMTAFFRSVKDVDTVDYNSVKRVIYLTRNPPHFESVYNEKGERIAVKYNKELPFEPDIKKWVSSWKTEFTSKFGGVELDAEEKMTESVLECLPTDFEDFVKTFVDGLKIKNALLMGRRIQGLVSYYKGANENLLPKQLDEDKMLTKIEMSETQFNRYLTVRSEEIRSDSNKKRRGGLNDEMGSYRMISRMACNYAVPSEFRPSKWDRNEDEDDSGEGKIDIVKKLLEDSEKYLSKQGLKQYSPKMLRLLEDLEASVGKKDEWNNQFVYSQYLTAEGLGIFGEVLKKHGFQEYKLLKEGGVWKEDPEMDADKPAFGLFTGGTSGVDKERRELVRQIFNEDYGDRFPQVLKESIKKHRLCVFMASSAGAEGITLKKVRNVYIMEPYWTPGRIEQVIGRAIRIGSHLALPEEERTVTVKLYMTVFNKDQTIVAEGANIVMVRRADMVLKRYEGDEPREVFMSTDEFLYETAYEKSRLIKSIATVLKQSAIDCEIHRTMHSKNEPAIQCMRFDTTVTAEDLAYRPKYLSDERDALYKKNLVKRGRMLQRISVKGIFMIMDTVTREIFDHAAFEDNNRLIQIGELLGTNKIVFFPHVVL